MPSKCPHHDTTQVVQTVRSLAHHQNQHKWWSSGNSQLPPATKRVSVPAGERDSSRGGSSVASTIQGPNSTPTSLLNNSRVADITQHITSTPFARQQRSMNSPTATLGTSSHSRPAPGGTSTCRVVSSPSSGIAITPTPLGGLENLPTCIPGLETRAMIENPLRTQAAEENQQQRPWQCQLQVVFKPRSMVSGSCSIP